MCVSLFLVRCRWQLRGKFRHRGIAKQTRVRSKRARNPRSGWIFLHPEHCH